MATRGGKMRSVRRFNRGPQKEVDEFEPCWDLLRMALVDIHTKNAGKLSFEQLYRASYKIVLRKKGEILYDRVRAFEEDWFQDHIMPKIADLISRNLISIKLVQMPGSSANERRQMGEKFLRGVKDSWEDHNMSMNMVTDILMYLDRTWATEAKRPSIFAATIGLFRNKILRNSLTGAMGPDGLDVDQDLQIFDMLNAVVLDLINMERDGDIIDHNMVRGIVSMLEDLYETDDELDSQRLYVTVFEPRFLEASRRFYKDECARLLRNTDAGSWLRHTKRRLKEEQCRCKTMLSHLTEDKMAKVVEQALIKEPLDEFLAMEGSGLRAMIDGDRLEDLSILYELVSRIDANKNALRKGLQMRVGELGYDIEKALKNMDFSTAPASAQDGDDAEVDKSKAQPLNAAAQQTAAAIKWVDDVLQLKDKFDNLWSTCFAEDVVLQSAVSKSFSDFINAFPRSSEYVSLFIDDMLKRGIRGKSPIEVDHMLDNAIVLVRYLTDRDMFERYYQKHLARRLLHARSENEDVEREMISRMKQAAGGHFTMKFEGMFKDMALSKDLSRDYKEHIRSLGDADTKLTELSVHVLTTNNWPHEVMGRGAAVEEAKQNTCVYPPAIKRLQESFFSFYLKDRSGRVLTWLPSAGSADIKCTFPPIEGKESGPLSRERRYELTVSTFGMVVLSLFNDVPDGESLRFEEIRERTNMPPAELTRTLASLSLAAKARVLVKDPVNRTVRPGDRFAFNTHFVSKTVRIKAPTANPPSKVEDSDDRRDTERRNNQTRAHIVDAAIVRIMKSRKKLAHGDLVAQVIDQLVGRFKPEVVLIKKRIEDLLAREYLERLDGDTPMYGYLA